MKFDNKVAIITGGTDGIGAKVAELLYAQGASVVIASRSKAHVEKQAKALSPDGSRVLGIVCDVSDPEAVCLLVQHAVSRFGKIDFAINSAGITGESGKLIPDHSIENWNHVISTTPSGVFYCLKYEIPAMINNGGGAIVNLSAVNGMAGIIGLAPYTVAKHGVIGLTRTAALEYATRNIRINAVAPGYVDTPKMHEFPDSIRREFAASHPMNRMATTEEVASVIMFLLSDDASFCTGGVYPVDGGYLAQ